MNILNRDERLKAKKVDKFVPYFEVPKDVKRPPKNFKKITEEASKLIESYLAVVKPILPKPLYKAERTKLTNLCRTASLSAKDLSGFLSRVTELTKIAPKLLEN